MSDPVEAAKREEIIAGMAEKMRAMDDKNIAARVVGMLISAKGNLNDYQAILEIVLAAHGRARQGSDAP